MSACTTSYEELITVRVVVPTWEHVSPSAEHVPVFRASFPIPWVLVSRAWPHSELYLFSELVLCEEAGPCLQYPGRLQNLVCLQNPALFQELACVWGFCA